MGRTCRLCGWGELILAPLGLVGGTTLSSGFNAWANEACTSVYLHSSMSDDADS